MYIEPGLEEKIKQLQDDTTGNLGRTLGMEFLSFKKDEVIASMPVDERTIQPFGILHGGASVALAETVCSIGAWLNIDPEKQAAVGLEINANHIKAVRKGAKVIATARAIHRGGRVHVWEIHIHTEEGKLNCISRCTMAIVDRNKV